MQLAYNNFVGQLMSMLIVFIFLFCPYAPLLKIVEVLIPMKKCLENLIWKFISYLIDKETELKIQM